MAASDPLANVPSNWRKGMLPTEDGVYPGVSWADYQRINRLNMSRLVDIGESPYHFHEAEFKEKEDTDFLREGRAGHVSTFEPQRWFATYEFWDGKVRRGKEWDKFCEEHKGKEILTVAQRDRVIAIQKAVHADQYAGPLLRNGHAELTVLWTHREPAVGDRPGFSIQCKGRVDFANEALADLKTTARPRPELFEKQAWNLNYHVKAAWYRDGYAAATNGELRPFRLVVVGAKAPHPVQVYELNEELLTHGQTVYRGWLSTLNFCRERNYWPCYADGPIKLGLPAFVKNGEEEGEGEEPDELEYGNPEEQSDAA